MRAPVGFALLVVAVPLVVPVVAHADNFVELAGGLVTPMADDQWTDYVDASPKLAVRVGAGGELGALVSADWTPETIDDNGFGGVDVTAHRFRILLGGVMQRDIKPKLHGSFRFGLGIDATYVHIEGSFFGISIDSSDTDMGLALEPAAGLWFDIRPTVQIGGDLALPISILHDDGDDNDINLESYTSVDLDILFGVRFLSK